MRSSDRREFVISGSALSFGARRRQPTVIRFIEKEDSAKSKGVTAIPHSVGSRDRAYLSRRIGGDCKQARCSIFVVLPARTDSDHRLSRANRYCSLLVRPICFTWCKPAVQPSWFLVSCSLVQALATVLAPSSW